MEPVPDAADDVVFMRWKEKAFESKYGDDCGLTIAVSHLSGGWLRSA